MFENTAATPTKNAWMPAAAQATSGLFGSLVGLAMQKRTNRANKEMAKYAYSKDLEMWNRQNAYNSPEAQMERLKSAGLNPNLVYGQGAVANTGGQMPKYNAPTLDYNFTPPLRELTQGAIATYQDFSIKQAQIDNLRAQNKVIQEEAKIRSFRNFLNDMTKDEQVNRWGLTNIGLGLRNTNLGIQGEGMRQSQYWKDILNENIDVRDDTRQRLFDETYGEQKGIIQNKYKQGLQNLGTGRINQERLRRQIRLADQQLQQRSELFPISLDYQRQKVKNLGRTFELMEFQKELMNAQKDYKQLEIDTYMYQMYGNFAEKAMRAINEMNKNYRGFNTDKNSKAPWSGTLKTNPTKRPPSTRGTRNRVRPPGK